MTYVVCKPCLGTKDRSCVEVCPVDCFYNIKKQKYNDQFKMPVTAQGEAGMLMIHPDECINCGACETECPVEAIYEDSGVPSGGGGGSGGDDDGEDWRVFIKINEEETMGMSDEELDQSRCTSKG